MSPVVVRMEGAPFNLTDTPDADGDRFRVSDIEGLSGADYNIELIELHRDGSAFGKAKYPRREIVVKGIAAAQKTASDYDALRVRRKLENWAADWASSERWLYVDEPYGGIGYQMKVRPGGKLALPAPGANRQEFEIPFTCADPRKYSQNAETPSVDGSTVVTNSGNFPTYVVATLSTTRTNPWIQNNTTGNQRITLSGSIPAGSTVDFLARRTVRAGVGMEEMALRPRIWWFLQPGSNTITSDGPWTLSYRHAYR